MNWWNMTSGHTPDCCILVSIFKGISDLQTNFLVNRWSSLSTEHNQYYTHLSASILTTGLTPVTKETALLQLVTLQANMLSANLLFIVLKITAGLCLRKDKKWCKVTDYGPFDALRRPEHSYCISRTAIKFVCVIKCLYIHVCWK